MTLRPGLSLCALATSVLALLSTATSAATVHVQPEPGALSRAISAAADGDILILAPGRHSGPVRIEKSLTLEGNGAAVIAAQGSGSVITVTGENVVIRGLEIIGSGNSHETIDSGIKLERDARRVLVENNRLIGNLHGIHVLGAKDSTLRGNTIVGREDHRVNDRGNGVYVWNAPGTVVEGNTIRLGRDGIFVNASNGGTFRDNLFHDLRFAVHYMYANQSEVSGNISIGNHLGYALMFSNQIVVHNNMSLADKGHGLMLNYANNADVRGNLVRGGTQEKCTFIYNAHKNTIADNRFEGCEIGIHFTAGSERNAISGNAFIGNRNQVKYVGTRNVEWSDAGRGNYWSDHPGFDLDGDGFADSPFRPNDMMDHILWSQPAAKLLLGSPAVQLVRWSQAAFPAILPGGVLDSYPLMRAPEIAVPAHIAAMEAEAVQAWRTGRKDDADVDLNTGH